LEKIISEDHILIYRTLSIFRSYGFTDSFEVLSLLFVWTEDDVQRETATDVLLPQIFS